jgi:hypothetical protein
MDVNINHNFVTPVSTREILAPLENNTLELRGMKRSFNNAKEGAIQLRDA